MAHVRLKIRCTFPSLFAIGFAVLLFTVIHEGFSYSYSGQLRNPPVRALRTEHHNLVRELLLLLLQIRLLFFNFFLSE